MLVIGSKGHAYVCGQYASPVCAVVRHFAELTVVFYENMQLMSIFFLKFCQSFG